jgi:hypothetical protein
VNKGTPSITWPAPASITYGTALSAVQLNATANVPGTFSYTPVVGTVLQAGLGRTLSVTFTPTDTNNYNNAPSTTTIDVAKATATVTLGNLAVTYDGTPKAATASTSPAGLAVSLKYDGSSTAPTAVGSYAVVATVSDTNYSGSTTGTLTIGGLTTNFATSPAGLLVSVDGGAAQATPFTLVLNPGGHSIAVNPYQAGPAGTRYAWTGWSDSGAASHPITVSGSGATYTAAFKTQYYLTTSVYPTGAGSVSPASGYVDAGPVQVTATPNSGYQFANFSSALTGGANPQSLTVSGPMTVVANFTAQQPQLAASVTTRVDGAAPGTRDVTLVLTNMGPGAASNATITGISNITVLSGSGAVSVLSGIPATLGSISAGSSASAGTTFNWPDTAIRVQFRVSFTAAGGYSSYTTITANR